MMFFRQKKNHSGKQIGYRSELRLERQSSVLEQLERQICGARWNAEHSISCITGMAMGGLRTSALFTNEKLNEQASALTNLMQKTLPVVMHVFDRSTGNNQTLRLPFFRFFAGNSQQSADFTLLAHKLSEMALLPVMVIHAGGESEYVSHDPALIKAFLGNESDVIPCPTSAQTMLFGVVRRRLPEFWNPDQPMTIGLTMPAILRDRQWAARKTFFNNHVDALLQTILDDFAAMTGRSYQAAEFQNESAQHQVVTTEVVGAHVRKDAPVVKINFMSAHLHRKLSHKTLSFIDRNHSRALSTALNLPGFSLVHYDEINDRALDAALGLTPERPMDIAGVRFLFQKPLSPKEEIFNQNILDLYDLPQSVEPDMPKWAIAEGPIALAQHPVVSEPLADLHRFWAHNGKFLASGQSGQVVATPMLATGILPAGSGKMLDASADVCAVRVVEPQDLVSTLLLRMGQENYETQNIESCARTLSGILRSHLQAGLTFDQWVERSFAELLSKYTGDMAALTGELSNARFFLPTACFLVEPFVSQGGVRVEDRTREHRKFFEYLPNTAAQFLRDPENVLLDKDAFQSFVRTENTAAQAIQHLFSAVARVESRKKSQALLERVQKNLVALRLLISQKLSVSLSGDLDKVLAQMSENDLTLAELAQKLDREQAPVDKQWLLHVNRMQNALIAMQKLYSEGSSGQGRASHGIISQNATGVYPWSPVVVPWAQNGNGEGIELALGIWEAHMARILPDFVTLRKVELELKGRYNARIHDHFFEEFTWKQLSQEELALCPPLVVTGTDTDFYHRPGSLGDLFRSSAPIKVLILDTLRSNPANLVQQLVANDIFVVQGCLSERAHLLTGMAQAFSSPKAAVMQVLSPMVRDFEAFSQRALDAAVYPLYTAMTGDYEQSIVLHPRTMLDAGFFQGQTLLDLLVQDPAYAQYFTEISAQTGTPLLEYLALDEEDRLETIPIVKSGKHFQIARPMIERVHELERCKGLLRKLKGLDRPVVDPMVLLEQARAQVIETVTASLVAMAKD